MRLDDHTAGWGVVLVLACLQTAACDRVASYTPGARAADAATRLVDARLDRLSGDRLPAEAGIDGAGVDGSGDGPIDGWGDGVAADGIVDVPVDQTSCLCTPSDPPEACGPCNLGSKTCRPDCMGYEPCDVPATVCQPQSTRPCGNCLGGEQTCGGDCRWGDCLGQPCTPDSKLQCLNGCGERTCSADCQWSGCSNSGLLVSPGQDCWSSNHCVTCGYASGGKCVACWQRCDDDGNLHPDGWCQTCTPCAGRSTPCPECG